VGGVVGGREGRVTVRDSTVNLLQLAEETLRISFSALRGIFEMFA
jgi:hypothetical protein